jgi:transcriptional regulator with XRE-family HTH domain
MSRRSHSSHDPSSVRGSALTPEAMSKQKFGRRLQQLLNERNWSQSDLTRRVEAVTGSRMGRDAVSTYINGRSLPTPKSLNQLCQAFGLTREDLLPNAIINTTPDDHPAFEMRAVAGQPDRAWVRVNRQMSFKTATDIAGLLSAEDSQSPPGNDDGIANGS